MHRTETTITGGEGGGTTRRTVLKGATVAVGAFIALDAIGGVGLAAGAAPKPTSLASAVIYPDPTLCIGCLTCEVICSQVHKARGLSDLPRIRIFQRPERPGRPGSPGRLPGSWLIPPGAVPAMPDGRMPVCVSRQCIAHRADQRGALHRRGRLRLVPPLRGGLHFPHEPRRQRHQPAQIQPDVTDFV